MTTTSLHHYNIYTPPHNPSDNTNTIQPVNLTAAFAHESQPTQNMPPRGSNQGPYEPATAATAAAAPTSVPPRAQQQLQQQSNDTPARQPHMQALPRSPPVFTAAPAAQTTHDANRQQQQLQQPPTAAPTSTSAASFLGTAPTGTTTTSHTTKRLGSTVRDSALLAQQNYFSSSPDSKKPRSGSADAGHDMIPDTLPNDHPPPSDHAAQASTHTDPPPVPQIHPMLSRVSEEGATGSIFDATLSCAADYLCAAIVHGGAAIHFLWWLFVACLLQGLERYNFLLCSVIVLPVFFQWSWFIVSCLVQGLVAITSPCTLR